MCWRSCVDKNFVTYEEVETTSNKVYEHEIYYLRDKHGKVCMIRASFDQDKFFLRSACMISGMEKTPIKEYLPSLIGTETYAQ
jgi:hypothetical protein